MPGGVSKVARTLPAGSSSCVVVMRDHNQKARNRPQSAECGPGKARVARRSVVASERLRQQRP